MKRIVRNPSVVLAAALVSLLTSRLAFAAEDDHDFMPPHGCVLPSKISS